MCVVVKDTAGPRSVSNNILRRSLILFAPSSYLHICSAVSRRRVRLRRQTRETELTISSEQMSFPVGQEIKQAFTQHSGHIGNFTAAFDCDCVRRQRRHEQPMTDDSMSGTNDDRREGASPRGSRKYLMSKHLTLQNLIDFSCLNHSQIESTTILLLKCIIS